MRTLAKLASVLLLTAPLFAAGPFTINSSTSPCATIGIGPDVGATVTVKVVGTFSATLQPEVAMAGQAADNTIVIPSTSQTTQSTITAVGTYYAIQVAGNDTFQLCVTSYASGTATIYLQNSNKNVAMLGGGGGGGDAITSPNSTLAVGGTSVATTLDLNGAAGKIMAGATPALTATPTLGLSGTTGSLTIVNTNNTTSNVITENTTGLTLGTITSGTWNGTLIGSTFGGTGVNNGSATITLGSSSLNFATLGTGIVKNTTTTGALTNGAAADIYGLFTSCTGSSGLFLKDGGTCASPSGAISSVSNSDGTLTISPTTGAVVASIALGHANTWTAAQALGSSTATTQTQNDNSTKLSTTAYTDLAVANAVAGVNPAVAVNAATTQASDTSGLTYNNGASGIGATFTGTTNTAITIDGFTFTAVGQRLLVKNDTQSPSGAFNGIYNVTQIQTGILPPILTRALDYDQPSDMNNTGSIPVISGTANASTSWLLTSSVVTVGTTPLTFTQFSMNPSNLVTAVSPGVGLCHFAGSTQACTSSTVATADIAANAVTAPKLAAQYPKLRCEPGLGDGLNAIAAGTYLQSTCYNDSAVTWTITGVRCFTDNSGSSTLNAAGNTLGALLTGAVTCSSAFAAGTQSANVALTSGDYIKFTFVADGTSKQTTWVVSMTQ